MTEQEYTEAVEWLFVQAPNYQIDGKKAYKPGLQNIMKLCAFFGNPQDKIKTVHIGGTNGKGSTSNMLASVLQEAGYKVGLYNSPHLIDFTERIKVNGKTADKFFVFYFIQKLKNIPADIRPSFFEFTTIMAFEYFYRENVDVAIIEVGLGGRLDSTNIIIPLVSAISNVALDHMNILGDTVEKIAAEKSGIIKKNVPVIIGDENKEVQSIFSAKAQDEGARLVDATKIKADLPSDLKGDYQQKNKRVVLGILQELQKIGFDVSENHIRKGLLQVHQNTGFMGRWFEISNHPLIICDTAHNQAGLEMVFNQLNNIDKRKHIVLGFVKDKNIDEVIQILPKNSVFYFAKPYLNRGRHPEDYKDLLRQAKINYKIFDCLEEAYTAARQNVKDDEMIFIGGSNFIVGEFLEKNLQE